MLKYIFLIIISLMIIKEVYDCYCIIPEVKQIIPVMEESSYKTANEYIFNNVQAKRAPEEIVYNNPDPWTKLIIDKNNEYPYFYHIKITIPSLNDLMKWKEIIPNIEFNPNSGELIIPSKDEGSALAITNLIISNLYNNLSLDDIISDQLIQVSIAKAQSHELVRNKLKEQILAATNNKTVAKPSSNFERDLATRTPTQPAQVKNNDEIEAFDGNDYSNDYSFI